MDEKRPDHLAKARENIEQAKTTEDARAKALFVRFAMLRLDAANAHESYIADRLLAVAESASDILAATVIVDEPSEQVTPTVIADPSEEVTPTVITEESTPDLRPIADQLRELELNRQIDLVQGIVDDVEKQWWNLEEGDPARAERHELWEAYDKELRELKDAYERLFTQ